MIRKSNTVFDSLQPPRRIRFRLLLLLDDSMDP
jgi:hypothetical protein